MVLFAQSSYTYENGRHSAKTVSEVEPTKSFHHHHQPQQQQHQHKQQSSSRLPNMWQSCDFRVVRQQSVATTAITYSRASIYDLPRPIPIASCLVDVTSIKRVFITFYFILFFLVLCD